mmetsp:Transcript_7221/g.16527  ORF Transcript_7221/g.16527 Transcript_7221/m.16527 type:complete len:275 (+) Transcript_7221:213-1037(+)|eukprot:CAMPEP_0172607222 /NCGR_PEP_ID=MMETSP1068-20121228/27437_1 /TAXON_ID=35684 /ORGANISM="Pseudopedinella elastica, Strain CCMP716" /LENGTH=274 /DNA_ID=CAMNT_0013410167 /DNA_START=173 /DNA_END=997 /DNA_ORIENTATION=+
MASLRNAIPRKVHKERSQPTARKHLGLLEKKKDYIERARDFQRKVGKIKDLKKKAAFRNPDEFYYGMIKSRTEQGVHQVERNDGTDTLSHAEVQLLKDQDMGYLQMKQGMDERKAEKLQQNLHLMLDKPPNKHTIFFESEAEASKFDPATHFDTVPKLAGRAFNRPRKATLEGKTTGAVADDHAALGGASARLRSEGGLVSGPANMKQLKKLMKERKKAYTELAQRMERSDKLKRVLLHKQVEKNVMGKGAKRKVKDAANGAPAVYKWKRARAR